MVQYALNFQYQNSIQCNIWIIKKIIINIEILAYTSSSTEEKNKIIKCFRDLVSLFAIEQKSDETIQNVQ